MHARQAASCLQLAAGEKRQDDRCCSQTRDHVVTDTYDADNSTAPFRSMFMRRFVATIFDDGRLCVNCRTPGRLAQPNYRCATRRNTIFVFFGLRQMLTDLINTLTVTLGGGGRAPTKGLSPPPTEAHVTKYFSWHLVRLS